MAVVDLSDMRTAKFWRDVICEIFVTFILCYVNTIVLVKTFVGTGTVATPVQAGLAVGLTVFVMGESLGHMSGAVMNPAVSLALAATGRISIPRGVFYTIAQVGGALCASGAVYGLTPSDFRPNMPTFKVWDSLHPANGMVIEAIITLILVIAVLGAGDSRSRTPIIPSLPPGIAVAVGIMSSGKYSSACMNPCLALAMAVLAKSWTHHWVFWAGPYIGAVVGAVLYSLLRLPEVIEKRKEENEQKARELYQESGMTNLDEFRENGVSNEGFTSETKMVIEAINPGKQPELQSYKL